MTKRGYTVMELCQDGWSPCFKDQTFADLEDAKRFQYEMIMEYGPEYYNWNNIWIYDEALEDFIDA